MLALIDILMMIPYVYSDWVNYNNSIEGRTKIKTSVPEPDFTLD